MGASIESLQERVRGEVVEPGAPGYDEARKVYNGMHDRRPRAVARCVDAADVIATVETARDEGMDLAVRGGGHSVPGFGTVDDGLVIDLSGMRNVHVDPANAVARVGGGALLGDFNHATHAFGLATPAGVISTTGVGGLTLGGGMGYLTRKYGLSCDNLIAADVVTADGRQLRASADENTDLFWALRGGSGNFGVVTSFEFRLHPVNNIVGGPIFFELDAAADVMDFYRQYIAQAPEELGAFFMFQIAPPLPFIPEKRHGDTLCGVVTCWTGPEGDAAAVLKPLRDAGPVVAEHVGPMPYPALNSAFDALLPPGLQQYWKADYVKELTDDAIPLHVEHGSRVPTVNSLMHLYPIDGAVQRVRPDETAFSYRDVSFACVIAGIWPDPADNEANTKWVRDYWSAIHPYSGTDGGYVNFMSEDDQYRAEANYGANYARLAQVKATYDPENLFHLNQNIKPAR
jgi:FAD/FMN-containing dehydrogenase